MIDRRSWMILLAAGSSARAWGAHDWQPYEMAAPFYIEGPVVTIMWYDPHPHLELLHRPGYALPADLARRRMRTQKEPQKVARLIERATVPLSPEGNWRVELPELNRMVERGVERPRIDRRLGVIGFPGPMVTGTPTLRAEILFIGADAYPLYSELT